MEKVKILIPESNISKLIHKSLYDAIEYRSIDSPSKWGKIKYLHLNLCSARNIPKSTKKKLRAFSRFQKKNCDTLKFLSIHLLSQFKKTIEKNKKLFGIGKPLAKNKLLAKTKKNIRFLKKLFPKTKILIENNNDLGTSAYKKVTEPILFSKIISFSKAGILLDLAHAQISARNQKKNLKEYLQSLDKSNIYGLHLSRPCLQRKIYDSHWLPNLSQVNFLNQNKKTFNIEFVTIEYYKNFKKLNSFLRKIKKGNEKHFYFKK